MGCERIHLTDEAVEMEIERLRDSEAVRLARKEIRLKYKRRQTLYLLRNLEKRGKCLMEAGVTLENVDRYAMQAAMENRELVGDEE